MRSPNKVKMMFDAMFDKRLYGPSFFLWSGPSLAVGFVIEVGILYILNRLMLLFYVPLFIAIVLVSGLGSKNYVRRSEVSNMGYFRCFLFLVASVLAVPMPFLLRFPDDLYGSFQFLLMSAVSTIALTVAIIEITVFGQRVSLRDKTQLTDSFFKRQKNIWKKETEGFPNSEKIIDDLENGKYVASLFDRGSFNLAVLWSCNVMETIIDTIADAIISKDPEKRSFFKKTNGSPERYPLQLKNLGYKPWSKNGTKEEQESIEKLWHKVRNDIAHYNIKPTFHETYEALGILVSFMEDMPETLEHWNPLERI